MAEIAPLTPLRYDLRRLGADSLSSVVAPPYDVIGHEERRALAARHPHNIVQLILPEGEGDAKYANAADLFTRWCSEGVLVRDEEPAFYRYEQTFAPPSGGTPRTRKGFCGLVKLEPFDRRIVLPHERTLSGPKEDRFKLFTATKTNFSPGFMLYRDPKRVLDAPLGHHEELAAFRTNDGIEHRLSKVTDPEALREIVSFIAGSSLLIADGHHRYETALRFQRAAQAVPGIVRPEPNYFMVYFANGDDPDLLVFPTHRIVHSLPRFDYAETLKLVGDLFDVTPLVPGASAEVYLDELRRAGQARQSLVICSGDGRAALLSLRAGADLASHSVLGKCVPALAKTDVALLHMGIFEPVLGMTPEAQAAKTNLRYPQDAQKALSEVRGNQGQALFLMNPTPVSDVRDVAEAGEVMPQKSTFFYPKVITGLCIHSLRGDRSVTHV